MPGAPFKLCRGRRLSKRRLGDQGEALALRYLGGGKGTCLSNATTGRATARSISSCATGEPCSYRFQGKQAKELARTGRVAAVSILGNCRQSPRSSPSWSWVWHLWRHGCRRAEQLESIHSSRCEWNNSDQDGQFAPRPATKDMSLGSLFADELHATNSGESGHTITGLRPFASASAWR